MVQMHCGNNEEPCNIICRYGCFYIPRDLVKMCSGLKVSVWAEVMNPVTQADRVFSQDLRQKWSILQPFNTKKITPNKTRRKTSPQPRSRFSFWQQYNESVEGGVRIKVLGNLCHSVYHVVSLNVFGHVWSRITCFICVMMVWTEGLWSLLTDVMIIYCVQCLVSKENEKCRIYL